MAALRLGCQVPMPTNSSASQAVLLLLCRASRFELLLVFQSRMAALTVVVTLAAEQIPPPLTATSQALYSPPLPDIAILQLLHQRLYPSMVGALPTIISIDNFSLTFCLGGLRCNLNSRQQKGVATEQSLCTRFGLTQGDTMSLRQRLKELWVGCFGEWTSKQSDEDREISAGKCMQILSFSHLDPAMLEKLLSSSPRLFPVDASRLVCHTSSMI